MNVLQRFVARVTERAERNKLATFVVASFVFTALIPIFSRSPTADVSGFYTDHLHHPFAAWVALTRGLGAVYRMPFAEAWQGSTWPFPLREWPNMPAMAYPPGVLVLYAPLAVVGRFAHLSEHGFAVFSILTVLALAHVSLYFVLQLLRELPAGGRLPVAALVYVQFLEFGLQGFHDSLVFGLAAYSLTRFMRKDIGGALAAFSFAMSLHYRAGAPFAAIGLLLLFEFYRGEKTRRGWLGFVTLAVIGLLSLVTLFWSIGLASKELLHLEIVVATRRLQLLVSLPLFAYALLLFRSREWISAVATVMSLGLVLSERCPFYWHGAILLAAPLLIGANAPTLERGRALLLRSVGLALFVWMRPVVWRDSVDYILREITRSFVG